MNKIIITLLLCSCATAYGAEVDNALLKKNLEAATIQIEVLKAQVEVMKSYQDKFLSTVYWSLGTVAALVVFLAGFNWFTSNRNAEKEAVLHKEMISNELNSIKNSIDQQILDLKEDFKNELNNDVKNIKVMQSENNANLKSELEAKISKKYDDNFFEIQRDYKSIERDLLLLKYSFLMEKERFSTALRTATQLLKLSENDHEYWVSNAFEKIQDSLKAIIKSSNSVFIDADDQAKIVKTMKPFNESHKIFIDNINSQLSKLQTLK